MRRFCNRSSSKVTTTEDCFTISMSDLMAGLLSIFILILVAFMIQFSQVHAKTEKKLAEISGNDKLREEILNEVQQEFYKNIKKHIRIDIKASQGILRFPAGLLFESGKEYLKKEARNDYIPSLTEAFVKVLNKNKYKSKVDAILIEGHADTQALKSNGRCNDNWELSAYRATNTRKEMLNYWNYSHKRNKNTLDDVLRNRNGEPLISCSAYGDSRPIDRGKDEIALGKNRRIDFRILMNPNIKEEDLKKFIPKQSAQSIDPGGQRKDARDTNRIK